MVRVRVSVRCNGLNSFVAGIVGLGSGLWL